MPEDVWNEAARHYDEQGLASLLIAIATSRPVIEPVSKQSSAAGIDTDGSTR